MNGFKPIKPEALSDNMFKLIAKDWTLITAGDEHAYNMMTANWLGVGYLWQKNVCFLFVRHSRYTYEFIERCDTLSLSFFTDAYRGVLNRCGVESGRKINKMKDCGLTPVPLFGGCVAFDEARLVFNCKKICLADLNEFTFLDPALLNNYADNDYHRLYICEITEAFIKE